MRATALSVLCFLLSCRPFVAAPPDADAVAISYHADSGVPLRVYLTARVNKRLNAPVHAKLLEPIFSFNREFIPANSEVTGHVSRLVPVTRYRRVSALLGGDFTPLHQAEVEFTSVTLPDGRQVPFHTVGTTGLNSIYSAAKAKRASAAKQQKTGGAVSVKQQVKDQIKKQIDSKTQSIADMVRSPNKMEQVEEFLLMKLPYHPQWVRNGTRFDADLLDAVDFGQGTVDRSDLAKLGSQPSSDSVVHSRLLATVTSGTAKAGDKIEAVVSEPLFSSDNKLVLPQGTRLTGTVTQAHRARWFHRGGQLRFAFDSVDLPEGYPRPAATAEPPVTRVQAVVDSAESGGAAQLEVDQEGNVKAVESKTRLILPAISVLIATQSGDNDAGHIRRNGTVESDGGGDSLGGGLGFGLLGSIAARSSQPLGMALGYYGLGWSVYRNILARGVEVEFRKDAAMDIRFDSRPPVEQSKFLSAAKN
jgi:hypothetical protein